MKFFRFALLSLGLVAASFVTLADGQEAPKPAPDSLKTDRQKASYGIGLSIGTQVQSLDPDLNSLVQGIKDSIAGQPALSDKEIQSAVAAYQQELQAKRAKVAEEMAKKGPAFLAENKKKPGVVTTDSGLQYKVLKEGTGKVAKATDTAVVNYEGRLIDGTVFDSSAKHGGKPADFPVGRVIKGFSEALQLMKTGSKWQLYVPTELAYGANPPTAKIPPNSPLIFDLEVVDVKPGVELPGVR
jgi:FKBP-type peptidyl-prolyl cis-trans isomerase FklB